MQQLDSFANRRTQYYIVYALVSLFMAAGTTGLVWWIAYNKTLFPPAPPPPNANYVNYDTGTGYVSAASTAAIQAYIAQFPQPQNVQVLTGLSTAEIYGYMQTYVSGGLKVDCSYCHNVANFADEANPMKAKARLMLQMNKDLNQNWISKLPAAAGNKQITCATCHNGKAKNFNGVASTNLLSNYPSDQAPLPDTYQLPLANLDVLLITGKKDPDLNAVQYNQQTMNHMNYSLGVGCAFCHNANYFPSNEKPQKAWALTMLQMSQHIQKNYNDSMALKAPSCWMCHQQQQLPPGAANAGKLPPQIAAPAATQ